MKYYDNFYTGILTFVGKDKEGEQLVYSVSTDLSYETAEKTAIALYTSIMPLYHNISSKVLVLKKDGKRDSVIDLQVLIDGSKTLNEEDPFNTPRVLH